MKAIVKFVKKETVFTIAVILAIGSMFLVPPNADYVGYIDFRVLALLFCLMFIVAGVREQGIFRRLAEKLTKNVRDVRLLELILVLLPFFSSMLITNDVALITFVPFALALLNGAEMKHRIIRVVVLQTIAANLGSMLTPIGNPQNLYLYSVSGMGIGQFLIKMLPLTALSLFLLIVTVLIGRKETLSVTFPKPDWKINKGKLSMLAVLFVLCMGTVVRLVPWYIPLAAVIIAGLIFCRNLFKNVDYFLLGTFCAFFIFVGNMQHVPAVSSFIDNALEGHEMLVSLALSQIISNVPATMLLSGFTDKYEALLYGVNIGGLGTLIASLASLISYKFYAVTENSKKGKYIVEFTVYNVIFLIILVGFKYLIG